MAEASYWSHSARSRIRRRRLLSVASGGVGVVALGLAGCSGAGKSSGAGSGTSAQSSTGRETPRPGGTFTTTIPYNATLDPQKGSASPQQVVSGVYSRLFRFKAGADPKIINNHDLENDLGLSAESPDATTWTIKMRPDAKFTDIPPVSGHAVEAEDVKATFTRAVDPATGNPNRGSLGMIDPSQIQTPDKNTLVFKLKFPYAPFAKALAAPSYSLILPREALAGAYDPSKVVIGSGPFTLESYTPDVAYVYKKNPGWFEAGRPYVDGVRMAIVPDSSQRLAQFTAGNIDEYLPETDDLAEAKQRNPKATLIAGVNGTPYPSYWQMGDPTSPFLDIRVRRALSMALDRDALTKVIFNGQAVAPVFIPGYMGKWSLKVSDLAPSAQQYYKHDPAQAKQLLAAAGASDLQLKFGYIVNGPLGFAPTPLYKKYSETVSNMLNDAGIKANLVSIDYNKDFIDTGKGINNGYFSKDMLVFSNISPYTEPDEFFFNYLHSKSTRPMMNLKDPDLDAMIDKQRTIVDEDQRLKEVQDIQKYLADKMYVLAAVGPYQYNMVQPRVRDYAYSDTRAYMTESYAKLWLNA